MRVGLEKNNISDALFDVGVVDKAEEFLEKSFLHLIFENIGFSFIQNHRFMALTHHLGQRCQTCCSHNISE